MTEDSDVIPPDDQEQIADALEDSAQLVSTHTSRNCWRTSPGDQEEIIRINTDAGDWPCRWRCSSRCSPCLLGFLNSFRMVHARLQAVRCCRGLLGG